MDIIADPGDFLGINYYTRAIIGDGSDQPMLQTRQAMLESCEVTAMGWEVHPQSLYELLQRIRREYADIDLYIAENGSAEHDRLVDGEVRDDKRIEYVRSHLEQAWRFIEKGGQLRGYFLWSFLDNFEWAYGYDKRFGIVYVDFDTQVRTPKQSAYWYKSVMESNALPDKYEAVP